MSRASAGLQIETACIIIVTVKSKLIASLFCAVVFLCGPVHTAQKPGSTKDLSPHYRKWLEEEVVYIISQTEKEVFLQLETDREREIFINAFWKQRDPTPNTPENEFRNEHYRRIQYANNWFGKDAPGPGWQSDMGRIYIILGEPKAIDRYENFAELYPTVVWFYQGLVDYGLPNGFSVVFFKRGNAGDYVLYSPVKDGPQSLLIHYNQDMARPELAYGELLKIQPTLANVSLALIDGESSAQLTPSIASEVLIGTKIPNAPVYKVKDTYAEKLLKYKDFIEYDYSTNYIENDFMLRILQGPTGLFFVHYLIEPSRLTFEQYEQNFTSNLEVNGTVVDSQGTTVYQYEKKVPIVFSEDQLANIQNKLFSFHDIIPLIPGDYQLNVILKNTVSKEFTSIESRIVIPGSPSLAMSRPVLANRLDANSKYSGQNKSFLVGDKQLRPSPRNDFMQDDTLYAYIQLRGLTDDLVARGTLEFTVLKEDEEVASRARRLEEYADPANIIEEFPLAEYPPAYYTVLATLKTEGGDMVLTGKEPFFITQRQFLARPWNISMPLPASGDPLIANILGGQFLSTKNIGRARPLLEDAYRRVPANPKFALDAARAFFLEEEYVEVKEIVRPHLEGLEGAPYLLLMAQSCQALKQYVDAIDFYKIYLTSHGTNLNVLNAIGECHAALGEIDEALTALERSLEINPDQPKIRDLVKALKEKRQ